MLAPVVKKLVLNNNTLVERALPAEGALYTKEGDLVKPFDRIGECTFSQKEISYPHSFNAYKFKGDHKFYYNGSQLGKLGAKKVPAPFNGELYKNEKGYIFKETENRYTLLSGVWGTVQKVLDKRSVLLKTQTRDLLLAASTGIGASGELVVFPNPTEILEKYYLESFSKNNEGKIVYIGHFADIEIVKKAYEMGVSAIIAGSAHRETFNFAKSRNLGFGLISGFGKLETPEPVYRLLSVISYRYVFFQGERNILRIPSSPETEKEKEKPVSKTNRLGIIIKPVKKEMDIIALQNPYFGKIGTVDRVSESSIFVKFGNEKSLAEIKVPNFFLIE